MNATYGPTMKIPVPGQTPPQADNSGRSQPAGQTTGTTPGASTGATPNPAQSARQLLDQLELRQHQQVMARVSRVLEKTATAPEQLLLDVRGKSLVVNSDTRMQPGDWVRIMRAGNELRLMAQMSSEGTPQSRVAQQLAQHLPWQHRLDQGLAQLARLAQPAAGTPSTQGQGIPEPVREAVRTLAAQIPQAGRLAGAAQGDNPGRAIQEWISSSGLFAERQLAQSPASVPADLKLALNRIVSALLGQQGDNPQALNRYTPLTSPDLVQAPLQFPQAQQAPLTPPPAQDNLSTGQMLRLLAGMLNRITVNQLHSQTLTTRTTVDAPVATPTWLLELPWLDTNNQPRTAQLRLERHGDEEDGSDRPRRRVAQWRLTLAMDLDEAGQVTFELGLQNQQVSALIWAEKAATLKQANEDLPWFRQRLGDLGLDVVEMECRRGQPRGARTQLDHRLVDVKA